MGSLEAWGVAEGEERRTCFPAEALTGIAERFDDLEVELWHVKSAIERRAREAALRC
jgi:hypothetical protein